uniref:Anthranilate synthase alpha subunit 1, chloroplastic-like n=2 Tax=Cicer arietinum TaxID=3827 RepID=A0A3Q7XRZ7_CICAR|nr:anthranilate synthase alpha subunit 1, chloroplastic-like [Cicer arietinum]
MTQYTTFESFSSLKSESSSYSHVSQKQGKSKAANRFRRYQESNYMDPNQGLCLGALFDIAATNPRFWVGDLRMLKVSFYKVVEAAGHFPNIHIEQPNQVRAELWTAPIDVFWLLLVQRFLRVLRIEQKKIVNRPLAETCKRGKTLEEDEKLSAQLLKDEKQCAEHVMLVDLGHNDVGKVSKSGSVKVEKLRNVERYSHVMHISSMVTGELQDHLTCWDSLRAALPVGTVNGAPKVRAMQLIDELEVAMRGPYSRGFGYISFSSDMDIALAMRTIVFPTGTRYDTMYSYKDLNQRREWIAYLQAGAGIVVDSDTADEHQECQNKAAALARSIDLAESTFVDK